MNFVLAVSPMVRPKEHCKKANFLDAYFLDGCVPHTIQSLEKSGLRKTEKETFFMLLVHTQ